MFTPAPTGITSVICCTFCWRLNCVFRPTLVLCSSSKASAASIAISRRWIELIILKLTDLLNCLRFLALCAVNSNGCGCAVIHSTLHAGKWGWIFSRSGCWTKSVHFTKITCQIRKRLRTMTAIPVHVCHSQSHSPRKGILRYNTHSPIIISN